MSGHYLRLIPAEPHYIPPEQVHSVAIAELSRLAPDAKEIFVEIYDAVQFIDQGENFESVSCPLCGSDLKQWWGGAMDAAYKTRFEDLSVTMPCCGGQTSLNQLRYQCPAGFARFVLSAYNPNLSDEDLTASDLAAIEKILDCKIRLVWAMY